MMMHISIITIIITLPWLQKNHDQLMMMHISLIIIIIALVAEEPGGLSVPGLSLMLQLLVSRDGKVTDDISRTYTVEGSIFQNLNMFSVFGLSYLVGCCNAC